METDYCKILHDKKFSLKIAYRFNWSNTIYFRLSPVVDLIEKSLSFEVEQEVVDSNDSRQVLSLCLLQNLLSRFPSATFWQATLHERSVVQSLLSSLHHAVRARSLQIISAWRFRLVSDVMASFVDDAAGHTEGQLGSRILALHSACKSNSFTSPFLNLIQNWMMQLN